MTFSSKKSDDAPDPKHGAKYDAVHREGLAADGLPKVGDDGLPRQPGAKYDAVHQDGVPHDGLPRRDALLTKEERDALPEAERNALTSKEWAQPDAITPTDPNARKYGPVAVEEAALRAYIAYGASLGYKTLAGVALERWELLHQAEREAWRNAAFALLSTGTAAVAKPGTRATGGAVGGADARSDAEKSAIADDAAFRTTSAR